MLTYPLAERKVLAAERLTGLSGQHEGNHVRILLTGATGRVGANVARRLHSENHDIRALVVPNDPQRPKLDGLECLEIVEGGLQDLDACAEACRDVELVIHLAAQLVRGSTPVDDFFNINALGTLRLLEGLVDQGRIGGAARFVLASTDGTYRPGAPSAVPIVEVSPQHPGDYYGTSKLLGEIILRNQADQYDIPFTIMRFGTVVSPEEATAMFRADWIDTMLSRELLGRDSNIWPLFVDHEGLADEVRNQIPSPHNNPPVIVRGPDGDPWSLHILDVRDAVDGVLACAFNDSAIGEDFLIAGPVTTSYADAADAFSSVLDLDAVTVEVSTSWHLDMDVSKATELLGFTAQHSFGDTLAATVDNAADVVPVRL